MLWFYVVNGAQQGPVDEATLQQLAAGGTITPETLVWREGMSDWKPYRQVALTGFAGGPAAGAAPQDGAETVRCAECGGAFPAGQVLDYGGKKICVNCKPVFFQRMREAGESAVLAEMNYAGFWVRFAAKFIDGILLNVVSMIAQAFVGMSMFSPTKNAEMMQEHFAQFMVFAYAIPLLFSITYATWMNGRFGATLGKMALGLRIVRSDGAQLNYGRAFGRFWGEQVSGILCSVGYLIAAFDNPEKRALHDRMCDTRVVFKKK